MQPIIDLLTPQSNWTQKVEARSDLGNQVHPRSVHACCWCVLGAIEKVSPSSKIQMREKIALEIDPKSEDHYQTIANWNDHPSRTHIQVLDLLRKVTNVRQAPLRSHVSP